MSRNIEFVFPFGFPVPDPVPDKKIQLREWLRHFPDRSRQKNTVVGMVEAFSRPFPTAFIPNQELLHQVVTDIVIFVTSLYCINHDVVCFCVSQLFIRLRAAAKAKGEAKRTRPRDRSHRAGPAPEANAELQANLDVS
jgi:hypothetical protein